MSGICGVLVLDGNEPSMGDLDVMLEKLARRGPDGTNRWLEGPVAIGHTLLATTPEALVEKLPLTDAESGCTITADVRLDNREELLAALDLDGEDRVIGDGELMMRAYLKWGEDCPKHLLGDFAFAIWDPRSQSLFCARDHMGMRQFNYHHEPGRQLMFATEAEALLTHPAVPHRINEGRIADFLDEMEGVDFSSTFFEEIYRLPPAHWLRLDADGLAVRRYWTLRLPTELKLNSNDEYERAFLAVLTEAVRCRLRSPGTVGAMLSGGVDSNSVAAVAARLLKAEGRGPLRTYSALGPDAQSCQETRCIHSAMSNPDFLAYSVDHSDLGDYRADLKRLLENSPNPFDGHMTLVRSVYLLAHRQNERVVLDGAFGDLVVTSGNRTAELLRDGALRQAWREAQRDVRLWGEMTLLRMLASGAWVAFVPPGIRALRQKLTCYAEDLTIALKGLVGRRLAKRVSLASRRAVFRQHIGTYAPGAREYRLDQIRHPHTAAARERYDRIASSLAIEARDPFLDIRLVEFCLSLPSAVLKADGWPKHVVRRAMRGRVPDAILWRQGNTHLGLHFTRQLFRESPPWRQRWAELAGTLRPFVRPAALTQDVATWLRKTEPRKTTPMDSGTLVELFALGSWLARHGVQETLKVQEEHHVRP